MITSLTGKYKQLSTLLPAFSCSSVCQLANLSDKTWVLGQRPLRQPEFLRTQIRTKQFFDQLREIPAPLSPADRHGRKRTITTQNVAYVDIITTSNAVNVPMAKVLKDNFQQLYEIADSQEGFFTAKQAASVEYSTRMQTYPVRTGDCHWSFSGADRLVQMDGKRRLYPASWQDVFAELVNDTKIDLTLDAAFAVVANYYASLMPPGWHRFCKALSVCCSTYPAGYKQQTSLPAVTFSR